MIQNEIKIKNKNVKNIKNINVKECLLFSKILFKLINLSKVQVFEFSINKLQNNKYEEITHISNL